MAKKLLSLRLHRDPDKESYYRTEDGLFTVWRSPVVGDGLDPQRWFVNHRDFDETLRADGWVTKKEATEWLRNIYAECNECYFGGIQ